MYPTEIEKVKIEKEKSYKDRVIDYYLILENKQIFSQSEIIFYTIHKFYCSLLPESVKDFIKGR